jgi:hypothetical protein
MKQSKPYQGHVPDGLKSRDAAQKKEDGRVAAQHEADLAALDKAHHSNKGGTGSSERKG